MYNVGIVSSRPYCTIYMYMDLGDYVHTNRTCIHEQECSLQAYVPGHPRDGMALGDTTHHPPSLFKDTLSPLYHSQGF